jgi:hypothetical protein
VLKFYELLFTITKLSDEFVVDAVVAAAADGDDDVTVVTADDAVPSVPFVTADVAVSLLSVVATTVVIVDDDDAIVPVVSVVELSAVELSAIGLLAIERSIFMSKTNINNEVSKDEFLSIISMLLSLLITK